MESSGRVYLSGDKALELVQTKTVHTAMWLAIILGTIFEGSGLFMTPVFGTLLGGLVEVVRRKDVVTCDSYAKEVAKVVGQWGAGMMVFTLLMMFAFRW